MEALKIDKPIIHKPSTLPTKSVNNEEIIKMLILDSNSSKVSSRKKIMILTPENRIEKVISFSPRHNEKNKKIKKIEYKSQGEGHKSNIKQKVSGIAMSVHLPIPIKLYTEEMMSSVKEGMLFKFVTGGIIGVLLSTLDITISQLVTGLSFFILLVLIDLILSIIPGNIKPGSETEHNLQSKAWSFVTNMLAIVGSMAIHGFLQTMIPEPNIIQKFVVNLHMYVMGWVAMIYAYRIVKYVAMANRTRIPKFITEMFNKGQ